MMISQFSRHRSSSSSSSFNDNPTMDNTEQLFEKYRSFDPSLLSKPGTSFTFVDYFLGYLLRFVHKTLNILACFRYYRYYQNTILGRFIYGLISIGNEDSSKYVYKTIEKYNDEILSSKKPQHLAININETNVDQDRLSQIIGWCSRIRSLKTLTIYHRYFCDDSDDGIQEVNSLKVCRIGYKAGHQSLVEASRTLCSNNDSNSVITSEQISEQLRNRYPFPDPDFMICLGDGGGDNGTQFNSLNTFPMWQIRLTEIVFLAVGHRMLSCEQLCSALRRFACCQQRFGT